MLITGYIEDQTAKPAKGVSLKTKSLKSPNQPVENYMNRDAFTLSSSHPFLAPRPIIMDPQ